MPAPSRPQAATHAASSRRWRPRARSSSATPAQLPRKCDASISGSGTKSCNQRRRACSAGVAPEKSNTAPATKVDAAKRCGTSGPATCERLAATRRTAARLA
jgi:hypothetical protein